MRATRTYLRRTENGYVIHNGYQRPDHRCVVVTGGYTSRGFNYYLWQKNEVVSSHHGDGSTDAALRKARELVRGTATA